ncbi:hypothetical protein N7530_005522 [Penicillium desertorum]|uniref:Uncharacterized protein n=1 Tax=Penicillium desertorum TaxID=1303715 RepID=A0A9W9X0A2_9EURO|nr:hypothetical protein N7530_005522 [Penicillium desertorum]
MPQKGKLEKRPTCTKYKWEPSWSTGKLGAKMIRLIFCGFWMAFGMVVFSAAIMWCVEPSDHARATSIDNLYGAGGFKPEIERVDRVDSDPLKSQTRKSEHRPRVSIYLLPSAC